MRAGAGIACDRMGITGGRLTLCGKRSRRVAAHVRGIHWWPADHLAALCAHGARCDGDVSAGQTLGCGHSGHLGCFWLASEEKVAVSGDVLGVLGDVCYAHPGATPSPSVSRKRTFDSALKIST